MLSGHQNVFINWHITANCVEHYLLLLSCIWLGQYHQHSSCSLIDYSVTLPDSVVMFQLPTSSLSAVLLAGDGYPPDPSWRHASGHRRTTWLDHISSDTGMSLTDTFSLAQDHSQWRAVATAAKAMHTWLTDISVQCMQSTTLFYQLCCPFVHRVPVLSLIRMDMSQFLMIRCGYHSSFWAPLPLPNSNPLSGGIKYMGWEKWFATEISVYLRNGTR